MLETELVKKKAETLKRLEEGARLRGTVKNITDYGVFIDLGGIDGLLHITDISWGRVNHPSEHFTVGDEVEVVVLKFDPETERVSLGYKQRSDDPWTLVDKKYPIGSRVQGRVVSIVDYGAFVEIEEGVEGLIHVSEMSWTKKVVNPAKILEVGDEVEAIVSELDMDQRRISLSLRQTERNPWEELEDTHPEGSVIEGKVRNLTEFGAFVEITDGIDGLIHVSDMSWTKRVKHPSEVLKKGDTVKARITNIDVENQRVSLSIKEFMPNEWEEFADKHNPGDIARGQGRQRHRLRALHRHLQRSRRSRPRQRDRGSRRRQAGGLLQGRRLGAHAHPADRGGREEGRPLDARRGAAHRGGDRRAPGPGQGTPGWRGGARQEARCLAGSPRRIRVRDGGGGAKRETWSRSRDPETAGGLRAERPPSPCRQKGWEMTEPLKDGMTKAELVEEVARTTQLTKKHAEIIVNTVFDSIVHSLKDGEKIELRGFGSFRIRHRGARTGRNPEDRRQGEGPAQADPLLQAGQGAEGTAQRRVLKALGGAARRAPLGSLLKRPGCNSFSPPGGTRTSPRVRRRTPGASSVPRRATRTIRTAWWCMPAGITW